MTDSTTKRCSKCGETKPLSEFFKRRERPSGYASRCKLCFNTWQRGYKQRRKTEGPRERIRKIAPTDNKTCNRCGLVKPAIEFRSHRRTDGDGYYNQCQECERAYHRSVHESRKEYQRNYIAANRGRVYATQKAWKVRNRDHCLAWRREHDKRPKWRLYNRVQQHRRRVGKDTTVTTEQIQELMGRQTKCYYCGKPFNTKRKATIEHVIPLSKGGAHDISNIVLACGPCNFKKQNKIVRLL